MEDELNQQKEIQISKEELNNDLEKLGIELSPSYIKKPTQRKKLLAEIRKARQFENKVIYGIEEKKIEGFRDMESEIKDIALHNSQIERAITSEIRGLSEKPFKKAFYCLSQWILEKTQGSKKLTESPESLIRGQIARVENVATNLLQYSDLIDRKVDNAESHYNNTLHTLIRKYEESEHRKSKIDDASRLLSLTKEATENAEDFVTKTQYAFAHRKIRRRLNSEMHEVNRNQKAMLMLKNELPLLDALSSVSEAYSNALKDTYQEAIFMRQHLESVVDIYSNIRRSQKVIENLNGEIGLLHKYSNNMITSIKEGAINMVEKANQGGFFGKDYNSHKAVLDDVLNRIESTNNNAFLELEKRVNSYTAIERRLE